MKVDIQYIAEQRRRDRMARSLADALFVVLNIQFGYGLGPILGQDRLEDNHRAVYLWVRQQIELENVDCSFPALRKALANQLADACSE